MCSSKVPVELSGLGCSLWLEGGPRQHAAPRRQLGRKVKWWKRRNQRERDGSREQESMRTSKAGRNEAPRGDRETRRPTEMGKYGELHTQTQELWKVSRGGEESGAPLEREKKGRWREGPTESRREGRQQRKRSGAGGERNERQRLSGAVEPACAWGGWKPAQPSAVCRWDLQACPRRRLLPSLPHLGLSPQS